METKQLNWCVDHKSVYHLKKTTLHDCCTRRFLIKHKHCNTNKNQNVFLILIKKIIGECTSIRIVRVVCQHKRCYHCIAIKQNIDSYTVFKNVLMCQTNKRKQKLGILFSINLFTILLLNCSFAGRIDIFK